jgi:hypothetical protein
MDETEEALYRGHKGLYSLSVDLERIISEIEKRRKDGRVANKKIVNRLRELNVILKVLSKEWQRNTR